MAYPTVSAPYGLIPINLVGGHVFAGATRHIPIASGSGTAIFFGDVVKLAAGGILQKDVGTNAATPIGVFLGCSYTDPVMGKTFRQSIAAGVVASDIMGYVADDPDILMKVAVVNGTAISFLTRAAVGKNAVLVQNAGNTATGNSTVGVSSTAGTATTFPLRIVDVIAETAVAGNPGSYTEVVVKWNAGMHAYNNATGV